MLMFILCLQLAGKAELSYFKPCLLVWYLICSKNRKWQGKGIEAWKLIHGTSPAPISLPPHFVFGVITFPSPIP